MIIVIPGGVSVTTEGSVWKHVKCEKCGCEFSYPMWRKATAHTSNLESNAGMTRTEQSQVNSYSILDYKLSTEVDPLPCPECGWYQQAMVEMMRQKLFARGMSWEWAFALPIGGLGIITGFQALTSDKAAFKDISPSAALLMIAIGLAAITAALLISWYRSKRRAAFDLNRTGSKPPKVSWRIGPVLRRAEFDRLKQEAQSAGAGEAL